MSSTVRLTARAAPFYLLAIVALLTLPFLAGCPSTGGLRPDASFVNASRLIHSSISAEYVAYVQADENLTPAQKQNRVDAVSDYEFLLRTAEANVAGGVVRPTVPAPDEGGGGDE